MSRVLFGRVVVFPFHINQPLLVIFLGLEIHAVLPVNGYTAPFGNIADNIITRHGITALGNPDEEARRPLNNYTAFVLNLEGVFFVFDLDFAALNQFLRFCSGLGPFFLTALFFCQAVENTNGTNLTEANRRKKRFFGLVAGLLQHFFHVLLVHVLICDIAMLLKLSLQELPPFGDRQLLVLIFKELADFISGLAGLDNIEPVAARSEGVSVGDDFHLITCPELGCQRNHAAINLGSSCFLTDLSVDLIGKVNGTRVLRQRAHRSIRREDVDFLSQIALLDRVNKVLGIIRLVLKLHQLFDPVHPDG